MPLPNIVNGGAGAVAIQQALDALIVDRKGAVAPQNMSGFNITNVGILQTQQIYVAGKPLSDGSFGVRTATSTSNPQVWNIAATKVGNVDVRFNGLPQPQGNFTISGAVAQPALLNPDFESDFASWGTTSPEIVTTAGPHGGTKCVAIVSNNGYLYQTLSGLAAGASVTITAWVRADAGNTAYTFLELTDGASGPVVLSTGVTPGITWQQLTATYTVTSTHNIFIVLQRGTTGLGTIYFDDVASTVGTVINPGFETGDFTGWVILPNCIISTTNPFGGAKCASLIGDNAFIYQTVTGLTLGVIYTITAWFRGDTGTTAPAWVILRDSVGNGYLTTSLATTTSWQPIQINFTGTATGDVVVILQRGVGAGAAYFDLTTMSGGAVSSNWAITFSAGNQPLATGEDVTVSGNLS